MACLALFAVACYALLSYNYVPLNIENPANLFDYFRMGLWVNFMVQSSTSRYTFSNGEIPRRSERFS